MGGIGWKLSPHADESIETFYDSYELWIQYTFLINYWHVLVSTQKCVSAACAAVQLPWNETERNGKNDDRFVSALWYDTVWYCAVWCDVTTSVDSWPLLFCTVLERNLSHCTTVTIKWALMTVTQGHRLFHFFTFFNIFFFNFKCFHLHCIRKQNKTKAGMLLLTRGVNLNLMSPSAALHLCFGSHTV